jgi:PKD repeat protein
VAWFGDLSPLVNITVTDALPAAVFTASCAGRACAFNGSGSSDREGAIATYTWSFGDGSPAGTGVAPSHSYAANGTYSVTLTVTDSAGQAAQVVHSVAAVDTAPTAAFTASCAIRACTFNATGSSDREGAIASYAWSFGDGSPVVTGATPSHSYAANGTYSVTLTVTDSAGQLGELTRSVIAVDQAPVAGFSVVCIDRTCTADAEASSDDVLIAGYSWAWGDGTTTSGGSRVSAPSHSYASYGTYTITLTVADGAGQTGSTSHAVTVSPGPTAAFTASCIGAQCSFDASASGGLAAIIGYHWDWDDESTTDATTPLASHRYAFGDTFRVHLTVTDANGRTAGVTQAVVVVVP